MFLSEFVVGTFVGGAIVFLFPGVGAGGNTIYKRVRDYFKN